MATNVNVSEKLAALKAKMAATDVGGGNVEGFFTPPMGSTILRILPEVGTMPFFYQEVGQHVIPGEHGKDTYVTCPRFTTDGMHKCPICDLVHKLYNSAAEADKELASKLRVTKRYWMNIIVREAGDVGGNTAKGPYIYTPGVTIFTQLSALINSEYGDITHIDQGSDLELKREGEKINTKYTIFPRLARSLIPLHTDEDTMLNIIESAKDLSWVMLSDNPEEDAKLGKGYIVKLLPYERMIADTGLDPNITSSNDLQKLLSAKPQVATRSIRSAANEEEAFPVKTVRTDEVGEEFNRLRALRNK